MRADDRNRGLFFEQARDCPELLREPGETVISSEAPELQASDAAKQTTAMDWRKSSNFPDVGVASAEGGEAVEHLREGVGSADWQ